MKGKQIVKILVDIGMTIALLLLMTYELIGPAVHEWLGVGIFVLAVVHHVLNGRWSRSLLKGKYTALRIMQTALAVLVLLAMLGSMVSGIILSRHVFAALPISGGRAFARNLHMISAYWGFVLMALHLGVHWSMMMGMARKMTKGPSAARTWSLRAAALLVAGYGAYAFFRRQIGTYLLMMSHFVFFDYDEPLVFFLLDYLAVMGLFVCVGHYVAEGIRRLGRGNSKKLSMPERV